MSGGLDSVWTAVVLLIWGDCVKTAYRKPDPSQTAAERRPWRGEGQPGTRCSGRHRGGCVRQPALACYPIIAGGGSARCGPVLAPHPSQREYWAALVFSRRPALEAVVEGTDLRDRHDLPPSSRSGVVDGSSACLPGLRAVNWRTGEFADPSCRSSAPSRLFDRSLRSAQSVKSFAIRRLRR